MVVLAMCAYMFVAYMWCMIYNLKAFSRAGITACLGLLKMLKDVRGPVSVYMFANACGEVSGISPT